MPLARERPLTGIGFDGVRGLTEAAKLPHNDVLRMLVETGVLGLLAYLAAHRERVVSKTQILTAVWGYEGFDENVVEVHVSSLRRKLEADGEPRLLHTVRGRGYRLGETP